MTRNLNMIKYILILLLMSSQLSAIKISAKQKDDVIRVKLYLKDTSDNVHIKHITAYVDKRVVFDVTMNEYMSKTKLYKFSYKFKNYGDSIRFLITEKGGNIHNYHKKIISSTYNKNKLIQKVKNRPIIDFHKTHPKLWETTTIEEAIKEFYISNKTINGNIFLKTKVPINNLGSVDVRIKSKEKLESIIILQEGNRYSPVAIFSVPFDTEVDYKVFIRMRKNSNITLVGKGINGKIYQTNSISMLKNECANNNYQSCTSLGVFFYEGMEIEKDEDLAIELLKKGCNGGSFYACWFIQYIYKHVGNESLNADIQLCNHGNANACEEMGRHYLKDVKDSLTKRDKYNLKKDIPKAIWYFKRACIQDSKNSCEVLLEIANEALDKSDI